MRRALKCVVIGGDSEWIRSVERVLCDTSILRVRPIAFSDPLLALDFLLRDPVDAVVADLLMPEVHGLLFVEAVRHFGFCIPVILVSNEVSIKAEALASGANALLAKADLAAELMPALQRVALPAHRRKTGESRDNARRAREHVVVAAAR